MARRVPQATNERRLDPPAEDQPAAAAKACHATARVACGKGWTTHHHPPALAQGAAPLAMTPAPPAPAGTPRWRSPLLAPAPAAAATPQGARGSTRSAHRRRLGYARSARRPTASQPACRRAPRRFVQERNPSPPAALRWANTADRPERCGQRPYTAWTKPAAASGIHRYRAEGTAVRSTHPEAIRHRVIRYSVRHSPWPEHARWPVPDCLRATVPDVTFRALVLSGLSAQAGAVRTPPAQRRRGVPLHLQREKETGTTQAWKRKASLEYCMDIQYHNLCLRPACF